jgi:Asp-tRNA(Asn)/Glu-tRNA(Gln) amidotransferase A subunit family amidase
MDGLGIDFVPTKSVRDAAAALDAVAGNVPGDPYWAPPAPPFWLAAASEKPQRLRIAVSLKKLDGNALHTDCEAAVREAASEYLLAKDSLQHIARGAVHFFERLGGHGRIGPFASENTS